MRSYLLAVGAVFGLALAIAFSANAEIVGSTGLYGLVEKFAGTLASGANLILSGNGQIRFTNGTRCYDLADGDLICTNAAGTDGVEFDVTDGGSLTFKTQAAAQYAVAASHFTAQSATFSFRGAGDILSGSDDFIGFTSAASSIGTSDTGFLRSEAGVVGTATADTPTFGGALITPSLATTYASLRFCGNGPDGATSTYISPVAEPFAVANYEFGGSGCDGEDSTTETTADEVFTGSAIKIVGLACSAVCTGASAANDVVVFQLRDDAADVTSATCSTSALGGDGVAAQCVYRDGTPTTVAAASALAMKITMTDDDCNDAGDDFECRVFYTIH